MTRRSRAREAVLETLASKWTDLAEYLARRPATVLCIMLGALICVGMSTYAVVQADRTSSALEERSRNACERAEEFTPIVRMNCQKLFDRILTDPTPKQIEALRKLVEADHEH